jgi:hypothetical protein
VKIDEVESTKQDLLTSVRINNTVSLGRICELACFDGAGKLKVGFYLLMLALSTSAKGH